MHKTRYQAFVSSTYEDLIEERKEVVQAILENNCFPAGMELFPASNKKQWDVIKKVIDESDYYIVVIAGRYGTTITDENKKRISFTEREFDYALESKKPIIALLHQNMEELPENKCETNAKNRKRLLQFREKAKTGRVVAFWTNKDNLRAVAGNAINNLINDEDNEMIGWVSGIISRENSTEDMNNSPINEKQKNDIIEKIMGSIPNVFLTTKVETQNPNKYPFEKRIYGINRITLMNFAGTSFISGVKIASVYTDEFSEWLSKNLLNGKIEADIILTNPRSQAAKDAALCKMFPKGPKSNSHDIIITNINKLLEWKKKNPNAVINIKLTDAALPYGIMLAESDQNPNLDYMKIDLYSAHPRYDDYRPSFYLARVNDKTRQMYELFKSNLYNIKEKSIDCEQLSSLKWLKEEKNNIIVHRGIIDKHVKEHSITGYYRCIAKKKPMEVDLLFLKDGNIVLGREYSFYYKRDGRIISLSELSLKQLQKIKTEDCTTTDGEELPFLFEETMLLTDFLNLVNGKVPVIIELKEKYNESLETIRKRVDKVINIIRYYQGQFAVHSANPLVLACIKERDATIPCGQITWSFDGTDVSDLYRRMHQRLEFLPTFNKEFIVPDFLSLKVQELEDPEYFDRVCKCQELIKELGAIETPLLCWTVKSEKDKHIASMRGCSNIIAELDK